MLMVLAEILGRTGTQDLTLPPPKSGRTSLAVYPEVA